MVEISTSLLNAKKEEIIQTIYNLEVAGTDSFHMDVMDGEFVENNTEEMMKEYAEYIKNIAHTPMDIHLMVKDVPNYIKSYLTLEPNMIIFHLEACHEKQIREAIYEIISNDCKVGISIKPQTPIEEIYPYLPYIHRVLVMTVEPGKGGQAFMPEMLEKIKELSRFVYENDFETQIEVDGGINEQTAQEVIDAGAEVLVAGSYILKASSYKEAIQSLKK